MMWYWVIGIWICVEKGIWVGLGMNFIGMQFGMVEDIEIEGQKALPCCLVMTVMAFMGVQACMEMIPRVIGIGREWTHHKHHQYFQVNA